VKIKVLHKGEPRTKSNSHFFARKKVWIPTDIVAYERALREAALEQVTKKGVQPIAGPIKMTIIYYLGSRRTKDLPNLPKTTCDALNGIAYDDDSLIVDMTIKKFYDKENPRVEIIVEKAKLPKGHGWPLAERFLGANPDRATIRGQGEVNAKPRPKRKRATSKTVTARRSRKTRYRGT